MGPFLPIVLLVLVAAGVLAALAAGASKKRREESITAVCRRAGLTRQSRPFTSGNDPRWLPFRSLTPLKGRHKRVTWCASGTIDSREVIAIEHRYVVSTGQVTAVITHTCVACPCPAFWPQTDLRAANALHRLIERLGSGDLELESDRFNKRWRVSTTDADLALAILAPGVQTLLEDAPRAETWSIGAGWVRVCRKAVVKPEELPALLRRPADLMALVPPEMLAETPPEAP